MRYWWWPKLNRVPPPEFCKCTRNCLFSFFYISHKLWFKLAISFKDMITVTGTILEQSLAEFFNSQWNDCSTIPDMIVQHLLVRLFNSRWHVRFFSSQFVGFLFVLAEYLNSDIHCWRIVPRTCAYQGVRNVSFSENFAYVLKVGLSPSKKISLYLLQRKPFKNDEKCFLFQLKSSFRSQDI